MLLPSTRVRKGGRYTRSRPRIRQRGDASTGPSPCGVGSSARTRSSPSWRTTLFCAHCLAVRGSVATTCSGRAEDHLDGLLVRQPGQLVPGPPRPDRPDVEGDPSVTCWAPPCASSVKSAARHSSGSLEPAKKVRKKEIRPSAEQVTETSYPSAVSCTGGCPGSARKSSPIRARTAASAPSSLSTAAASPGMISTSTPFVPAEPWLAAQALVRPTPLDVEHGIRVERRDPNGKRVTDGPVRALTLTRVVRASLPRASTPSRGHHEYRTHNQGSFTSGSCGRTCRRRELRHTGKGRFMDHTRRAACRVWLDARRRTA